MTISVSTNQQTALAARHLGMVLFAYLDFADGSFASTPIRISTWNHDLTWGGYTWQGFGNLVSVANVKDSEKLETSSIDLNLNAANTTILSLSLAAPERYRGRNVILYMCPITNGVLVDTPIQFWSGTMDTMAVAYEADGGNVTLRVTPTSARLARASGLRMNHEQHKLAYPTELGFQYLNDLISHPQVWLSKKFQASLA